MGYSEAREQRGFTAGCREFLKGCNKDPATSRVAWRISKGCPDIPDPQPFGRRKIEDEEGRDCTAGRGDDCNFEEGKLNYDPDLGPGIKRQK